MRLKEQVCLKIMHEYFAKILGTGHQQPVFRLLFIADGMSRGTEKTCLLTLGLDGLL